ncbi:hypothetical protein Tco_1084873 [Tanacetum coccineum]
MPTTTTTVTETTTTTTTTTVLPPPQPQHDVSTLILIQTIGQLEQKIADLVDANQALEKRIDKQGNRIHQLESQDLSRLIREQTVEFIDSQEIDRKIEESVKEVVTASVQHVMRAPLRTRFKDLPTSDMKEILLQRMLEENYDKGHEDHKMAYEALQKSIIHDESEKFDADKAKEQIKKKMASGSNYWNSDSAQDPPPPPSSLTTKRGDQSHISTAPGSSRPADMGSDDEDNSSRHIAKVSLNQEWFKPLSKEERPATPKPVWSIPSSSLHVPNNNWASVIASSFVSPPENSLLSQTGNIGVFIDWFCKKQGITEHTPEHLEGPAYEVVKAFHPDVIHLQFQMEECHKLLTNQVDKGLLRYNVSRPLPLGGPPGQVMIQTEFFFNKDLEYLRFGHKGDRLALSITKMKVASYPDAWLEQMVPDQMWAEEEYMYDISASYGISHWWFKRQQFYIDRHSVVAPRKKIRSLFSLSKSYAKERTKKKSKQDSLKTPSGSPPPPPPPPPPSGAFGASGLIGTSDSAQDPPPPPPSLTTNQAYAAWITTTSIPEPAASSVPKDVLMHEESDFEAQDMGSDDEDSGSRHIPKVSLNQEWFKPLSEKERPATPEPAWSIPSSSLPVPNNNWASAIASSFVSPPENSLLSQTDDIGVFIDWFCKKQGITELTPKHLEVDEGLLRYNVSRPLPLGGPPGQVTIQTEFFFNKDLEYLRFGHKGDRLALSITKMKAASYPDAGLEQMVPDQMWAEEEYMYDISASYGISHWWFKRQQFYIERHSADTNRRAIVRTHMRILSVVRIEVFSLYGYDYMKKIVLRRADNQEYTIAESDFKDLYPSDFEDLYLLNLQGHLNHLPPKDKKILSTAVNLWIRNLVIRKRVEDFQLGIKSYQTQLNLTKPRWEATGLEFMHDYKILDSPRAVVFRDKYGMQMIMRFNEIHKFSDGTLQQIDEALDYRVKEFKVNKVNPGLNTRFWTTNDVIKSKQFMFAIQKRLKLRRIFRNLESFVGGRIREGGYRLLQRTE